MHTRQFGDVTIHRILELEEPFVHPTDIFDDATDAKIDPYRDWLEPNALCPDTGKIILPVQSYIIRTPHHTALIDTCIGCNKTSSIPDWSNRTDEVWLRNFKAAGFAPEDIDFVFCTHLHGDHCGWNTRLLDGRWVPSFPNAQYILAKTEVEACAANGPDTYRESVLPIIKAGQAKLVDADFALDDTLWLTPSHGHTAGHVCVNIRSQGQHAIMIGDMIHTPLQLAYPGWSPYFDNDLSQSATTRKTFFDQHCETDTLILTAHLPSPSVGHITGHPDRPYDFKYKAEDQ